MLHIVVTLYGKFSYIPWIQENKLRKFIEIIKKGTHLAKTFIINLSKMKKSNQNHE
jgi:hypothetical protein